MFKTLRRYYWVTEMFIRRHGSIILKTSAISLAAVGLLLVFDRFLPTPLHTVRIARVGSVSLSTLPQDIQSQVSSGLVAVAEDGTITPGLAKSWTVSPDGKTYTFTLDSTLKWGDGSSVTPQDVSYNFQNVGLKTGDNTVEFTLSEPFSPFYSAVASPILKNGRYGVGRYRISDLSEYNSNLQSVTLSGADRKIYKFYPTEASAITAYELGEVDEIDLLSYAPPELSRDLSNVVTESTSGRKMTVLFFNNNDSLLGSSNKAVRQALAYAIREKTFGHPRALSPIDKHSWAFNPLVKTYDFDPAHAKSLLAESVKDPSSITLELKTTLPYLDIAEGIAADWQTTLGITVNVKVVTNVESDYQVLLADFTPPVDPDQYTMWHSTQPTNFTHFTDLKVDKLLEDGRRTQDQKLRRDIYLDFQRFLLEDCPAVFLFNSASYTISRQPLF